MPPSWSTRLAPATVSPPRSVAATIRRPRALPVIGDGTQPDAERVAAVRPDLIIAWQPAAAEPLVRVMDKLGVPVYYSDPQTLADIPPRWNGWASCSAPRTRLGPPPGRCANGWTGWPRAMPTAGRCGSSSRPGWIPSTLNRTSIVSDALRLCGGVNVFADSPVVAPQVSLESVLAARPDAVLAGVSRQEDKANNLAAWRKLACRPPRPAVYGIDADALYRPGPA